MVAAVPWARHGAGHTRAFDETVAWLATQCSKTAVTELMRIAWRTVGAIVTRVWADIDALGRPAGRAAPDRDRRDLLQARPPLPDRRRRPRHRPAGVGRARPGPRPPCAASSTSSAPNAARAITHVVGRSGRLDRRGRRRTLPERGAVRRPVPRRRVGHRRPRRGPPPGLERRPPSRGRPRGQGQPATASPPATPARLKHARYALWKNPENLTDRQRDKLAWIAKTDPRLTAPTCSKKACATCSPSKAKPAKQALDRWLSWARRCRIPAFVHLANDASRSHRTAIDAALDHGLSNALDRIDQHQDPTPHPHRLRLPLTPTPSSPSPCSASAATDPPYPGRN